MRILIAAAAALLLYSCGDKGIPGGVLQPDKMQAVMWDVIKADIYAADYIKKDSAKNDTIESARLQQEIFAIHSITKEAYYRSYDYYKKNPELMKALMDTMSARVNRSRNITPTIVKPTQSVQ
jgi:Domain of unknown function (DUF4296)